METQLSIDWTLKPTVQSIRRRTIPIINGMVETVSGRKIPAPPAIRRYGSNRKTVNDVKKQAQWLVAQANAEYAATQPYAKWGLAGFDRYDPNRLTPAEYDTAHLFLFGEENPVFVDAFAVPELPPLARNKEQFLVFESPNCLVRKPNLFFLWLTADIRSQLSALVKSSRLPAAQPPLELDSADCFTFYDGDLKDHWVLMSKQMLDYQFPRRELPWTIKLRIVPGLCEELSLLAESSTHPARGYKGCGDWFPPCSTFYCHELIKESMSVFESILIN